MISPGKEVIKMSDDPRSTLSPAEQAIWDNQDKWQKREIRTMVHTFTLNSLRSAADVCRIRCSDDPDLLDVMARAMYEFLCDGDVYDQIVRKLVEIDPVYFGRKIGELDEAIAKKVVETILGSDES